ncbi:hypothetical protein ACFX13_033319 [Malus domestica]
MEKFFNKEWKVVGIYDAIKLLTIKITMDKELLMEALGFWCSTTNTMVLPLGLIGPTVLDISAILRTSLLGFSINISLSGCLSNLNIDTLRRTCGRVAKE